MDVTVFLISAAIVLVGALGVLVARNPVHAALFLVQTLFGVAVLFVLQDATFLAAVQVIVYAGAVVILFLFVIMLLGVDRAEDLGVEPIVGTHVSSECIVVLRDVLRKSPTLFATHCRDVVASSMVCPLKFSRVKL